MTDVQQLAEAIKNAAPVVWQAAYRQAFIEGIEHACASLLFAVLCWKTFFAESWLIGFCDRPDKEDRTFVKVISKAIAFLWFLAACGTGSEALERFINPTYAAVKLIGQALSK